MKSRSPSDSRGRIGVEKVAATRIGVVLPAAGSGERMGGVKKALLEIDGEPLLLHALRPFLAVEGVESVVVALPPADAGDPPGWLSDLDPRVRVVAGGATRGDSVHAALRVLDPGIAVVLVHDAARPLVTREIIERCVDGARFGEGAIAGWPVVDTLKEVDETGLILSTPDRSAFRGAQTPQAFPLEGLLEGYREAQRRAAVPTDDAQAFALAGGKVRVVPGDPWNFKVTHTEDLAIAGFLLRRRGEG